MRIPKWHCLHEWGFPRRWTEFEGRQNVDVQTCAKCGARRVSIVQFGRLAPIQDGHLEQCMGGPRP